MLPNITILNCLMPTKHVNAGGCIGGVPVKPNTHNESEQFQSERI